MTIANLLAACLVVKDEEKTVEATARSALSAVDSILVLDTGSEDLTREAANSVERVAVFQHLNCGGPFQNDLGEFHYAKARNAALDLAVGHRFALSLSADERLVGGEKLRAFLESYDGGEDAFLVELRTPVGAIDYPRVLRVGSLWRYEGDIHEEPRNMNEPDREPTVKIPGCWIENTVSDPERHARRWRVRDLPGLGRQLAMETNMKRRRRLLYLLAQTHGLISAHENSLANEHAHAGLIGEGHLIASAVHQAAGIAYYAYLAQLPQDSAADRNQCLWKLYNAMSVFGLYLPNEMAMRLQPLAEADPKNPAIAYQLAVSQAQMDARLGLQAAYRAAKVAKESVVDPEHPHDPYGLLWRPHLLAANCAKQLGHGPAAKKSAEEGIRMGGPAEAFAEFLDRKAAN